MDSFGASRGRRKKRLGDLLIEGGLINDEQLQQALQAQKESDVRQKLGTVLIDLGFASDDDIAEVLSRQYIKEPVIFTLSRWKSSFVSDSEWTVCFKRRCGMILRCSRRWSLVSRLSAVWTFQRNVSHRTVV